MTPWLLLWLIVSIGWWRLSWIGAQRWYDEKEKGGWDD
jgi:hypothetical protein